MNNTFKLGNVTYTMNDRSGYCYRTENGKTRRISKNEFNKTVKKYNEHTEDEMIERLVEEMENEEVARIQREMTDDMTSIAKKVAKKVPERIPHKNKVQVGGMEFTEGGVDIILTPKQVQFIRLLPDTQHWNEGVDSTLWINVLCDELDDKMGPMTIGAMVSTLREKHLLEVTVGSYDKKKAKAFRFTNTGKAVVFKVLGI